MNLGVYLNVLDHCGDALFLGSISYTLSNFLNFFFFQNFVKSTTLKFYFFKTEFPIKAALKNTLLWLL